MLGGGFAGTLAAIVLAQRSHSVTIVDRDRLSDNDAPRKGIPHGRHTHVLVSGGARALEELLPGITDRLYSLGAQRIGIPGRYMATAAGGGWFPRQDGKQFIIGCSRSLLEATIRERLLACQNITYVNSADVVGLTGDSVRITGARIRERATREERIIEADFVVDSTGRSSSASQWLVDLGLPAPQQEVVDPQIFYVTRRYRAPDGAHSMPAINIMADPARTDRVRGSGLLLPIEDGIWTVTLSGTVGGHPPADDAGFLDFAAELPYPTIAELLKLAEPLGSPFGFKADANRRLHFDKLPLPPGFVVMGDAACTFNPVYGHGLAVAARSAVALRAGLARGGVDASQDIQRAIAQASQDAWMMATSQDLRFPQTLGPRPEQRDGLRFRQRFQERLARAAMSRHPIAEAQMAVFTLSASPVTAFLRPSVLISALRGPDPNVQPLPDPPFTQQEREVLTRRS
ncbi:enterotoxin [Allokutzneria sp. A3M-2-11 16]|uniref:FAD-dependent oxidoreductase n=1 Tax=Allokutzneria sp. A3M-2-11 16 TaxID=2962043 RepID=UPI0020B6937F|nr:enterotoxin [Allokutzneria sp. A3M-2-11 16]MCP3800688.1 enterotoxin [Allokutzneria sp. A3M-2-11 16]